MWAVRDPERFTRALEASHTVTSRIELWSERQPVAEADFLHGEVVDTWVAAGIRRTLDLEVQPSRNWYRWLDLPLLEARVYRGIRYSRSSMEECLLGRFPIVTPDMSRPVNNISISAEDYYQRIVQADFSFPVQTETKPVTAAINDLFHNTILPFAGLVTPKILTTTTSVASGVLLEDSRHDAMVDYAESYGLEIYVDRDGVPTIADAQVPGVPATSVLAGPGETAEELSIKTDWAKVYNQISVTSSAPDVDFPAQVVVVTPDHPAAQWRIGARVKKFSSPLLLTEAEALKAGYTLLAKASAYARTYSYTCVPDPRRDAGDTILGSTMNGTHVAQIATVSHPLNADDRQSITTVSTQPDVEL